MTTRWPLGGPLVAAVLVVAAWARPQSAAGAPPATWAQARADEVQTLRAEREALRTSLVETRAQANAAKTALRQEITALSEELARLQVQRAAAERSLPARERSRSDRAQAESLDDLLARIADEAGADVPADPALRPAALPDMVRDLLQTARREGGLRLEADAEVFDGDGQLVPGPVLHVGRVAALRWDGSGRPLVATPDGLREVEGEFPPAQPHAAAVLATAVLYDARNPPRPGDVAAKGWRHTLETGGPMIWVLTALGAAAALVVLERTLALLWAGRRWVYERRRFADAVKNAHTSTLLHVQGWIAKPLVIAAAARCPSCSVHVDAQLEERTTQALMVMREQLQRRISLVHVAAGVAPLLGLLGTVTGMIHTFSVVTQTGTAEPQLLAAGISEALLTTQFGLGVAIPAYLAHALLSRGARRILASAEHTVLAYLHGGEGHGPAQRAGHADDHAHQPAPDAAAAEAGARAG